MTLQFLTPTGTPVAKKRGANHQYAAQQAWTGQAKAKQDVWSASNSNPGPQIPKPLSLPLRIHSLLQVWGKQGLAAMVLAAACYGFSRRTGRGGRECCDSCHLFLQGLGNLTLLYFISSPEYKRHILVLLGNIAKVRTKRGMWGCPRGCWNALLWKQLWAEMCWGHTRSWEQLGYIGGSLILGATQATAWVLSNAPGFAKSFCIFCLALFPSGPTPAPTGGAIPLVADEGSEMQRSRATYMKVASQLPGWSCLSVFCNCALYPLFIEKAKSLAICSEDSKSEFT